jgi:hypothetical protein
MANKAQVLGPQKERTEAYPEGHCQKCGNEAEVLRSIVSEHLVEEWCPDCVRKLGGQYAGIADRMEESVKGNKGKNDKEE